MIKLRSKMLSRSLSKLRGGAAAAAVDNSNNIGSGGGKGCNNNKIVNGDIKWEMRPGGMLVQKRECGENTVAKEGVIVVRVSTVSHWHDISIQPNSTFGELKMILSLVTSLAPNEQRLLYKGKEREDHEYLHMVGVREKDKVLLLEDPAIKERKLMGLAAGGVIGAPFRTISV